MLFPNIDKAVATLKEGFNSLSEDQKKKLDSKDFLPTMSSLSKGASMPSGSNLRLGDTKIEPAIGDSKIEPAIEDDAEEVPWWDVVGFAFILDDECVAKGSEVVQQAASKIDWLKMFHRINIVANTGFFVVDLNKFLELNKMCNEWNEGGEARMKVLEDPKFETELSMKKLTDTIRIEIAKGF